MDECNEAKQLLAELKEIGVALKLQDGKVRFSPQSGVTPELLARMKEHKDKLIAVLQIDLEETNSRQYSEVPGEAISKALELPHEYGGLRRTSFFGIVLFIAVSYELIISVLASNNAATASSLRYDDFDQGNPLFNVRTIVLQMSLLYPVALRIKNIGWNPVLCALVFVPFANMILGLLCLFQPEGHADKEQKSFSFRIK